MAKSHDTPPPPPVKIDGWNWPEDVDTSFLSDQVLVLGRELIWKELRRNGNISWTPLADLTRRTQHLTAAQRNALIWLMVEEGRVEKRVVLRERGGGRPTTYFRLKKQTRAKKEAA